MKSNSIELKELYDSIINSTFLYHKDSFKVFTYEAAVGKTTTIINVLNDLYVKSPKTKTLIVTKLKVEQEILKEKLGDKAKVVNGNYKINEKILHATPILIITHELYRRLCKDYKRRQYYIEDRTNLIIDEQLDLLEIKEFNAKRADEMRANLSKIRYSSEGHDYELNEIYGKIIYKLNDVLHQNYQSEMRFENIKDEQITEKIELLKGMIEKGNFPKGLRNQREKMIREIDFINHFYNNKYVIACSGVCQVSCRI
ncbi:DEAD/DEAH box helicase family protein [Tissierella praeacuta]|uniref:DEAD/DEAH box helicase family protein n=1 Tax=Tissierella praeacuta TaxID=43131 RepID=UPI003518CCA3